MSQVDGKADVAHADVAHADPAAPMHGGQSRARLLTHPQVVKEADCAVPVAGVKGSDMVELV